MAVTPKVDMSARLTEVLRLSFQRSICLHDLRMCYGRYSLGRCEHNHAPIDGLYDRQLTLLTRYEDSV